MEGDLKALKIENGRLNDEKYQSSARLNAELINSKEEQKQLKDDLIVALEKSKKSKSSIKEHVCLISC